MKCPVCYRETGYYKQEGVEPGTMERRPYPLYQRSYPGKPEYISGRCLECYEKAEGVKVMKIVADSQKLVKIVMEASEAGRKMLRTPCRDAMPEDNLPQLAEQMFATMKEANGLGLAANQLGFDVSMFVMKRDQYTPICIVNPYLKRKKGQQKRNETCLSLPGIEVVVNRPQIVKVKGYNQYWYPVTYSFRGIEAACVCHEMDHLIGKLIIDYKEEKGESRNRRDPL